VDKKLLALTKKASETVKSSEASYLEETSGFAQTLGSCLRLHTGHPDHNRTGPFQITHITFKNKKSHPEGGLFYFWRRRPDLNRRLYGFANRSLGPLGHVSITNGNILEVSAINRFLSRMLIALTVGKLNNS
jgi:hypothetical protein